MISRLLPRGPAGALLVFLGTPSSSCLAKLPWQQEITGMPDRCFYRGEVKITAIAAVTAEAAVPVVIVILVPSA